MLSSRPGFICCLHDKTFHSLKKQMLQFPSFTPPIPLSPRPTSPPPPFRKGQASKTQQPNTTKQDIIRQGKNPWRQDKQPNMRSLQGRAKESETHPLPLSGEPQRHRGAAVTHWGPEGSQPSSFDTPVMMTTAIPCLSLLQLSHRTCPSAHQPTL